MKVYIARPIPENAYQILRDAGIEFEVNPENRILSKQELIEAMRGKEILLPILTDTVDDEVLGSNPDLKLVANYGMGYDKIDVPAATQRGILVTNTPGAISETTADLAFALLLACGRKLFPADKLTRSGKFDKWEPLGFLGRDVYGSTLGIVGAGRIGSLVARRGKLGFNMNVLYCDQGVNKEMEKTLGAKKVSLDELLKQSDFVSLHVPLTEETRHMIGAEELKKMKTSAIIINTARGPVIDEAALAEALLSGSIAGAGLDVYEAEPQIHPKLFEVENIVLAPHIGSASVATREDMARIAAENIVAFVRGQKPISPVNPEVLG